MPKDKSIDLNTYFKKDEKLENNYLIIHLKKNSKLILTHLCKQKEKNKKKGRIQLNR